MLNCRARKHALAMTAGLAIVGAARAAELGRVAWHTDLQEAWQITQREGRPLLVFVTHDHCAHCVKMSRGTYADLRLAEAINRAFVPLAIDGGGASPLLKELRVAAFPATFIISPQAVVLDRIDGYVTPDVLATRLAATRNALALKEIRGP